MIDRQKSDQCRNAKSYCTSTACLCPTPQIHKSLSHAQLVNTVTCPNNILGKKWRARYSWKFPMWNPNLHHNRATHWLSWSAALPVQYHNTHSAFLNCIQYACGLHEANASCIQCIPLRVKHICIIAGGTVTCPTDVYCITYSCTSSYCIRKSYCTLCMLRHGTCGINTCLEGYSCMWLKIDT